MRKIFLQSLAVVLLLVALFTIFASPSAFAASYHAKTSAAATVPQDGTICYYRVTAQAGLWEHTQPALSSQHAGINNYNTIVDAYQSGDVYNSTDGYWWKQLGDGNWSARIYLQKTSNNCVI